jgi:predicted O-linked N-acetylglucosamine transferase (SPINDLY family)
MHCCDWRLFGEDSERIVAGVRAARRTVDPFFCLGVSDSAKDQLLCSQIWVRDRFPVQPVSISQGKRYSHDRIRLAYLSSDLGDHPVSLLMAGVFELHDRAGFETTAISFGRETRARCGRGSREPSTASSTCGTKAIAKWQV